MIKREARRHAHHVAYIWIQKALDAGPGENHALTEKERKQIEDELDRIAQRHFELGEKRGAAQP